MSDSQRIVTLAFLTAAAGAFAAETHYLPGWPVTGSSFRDSSPAVADVDNDGRLEIAVASWDGKLYLFDARGKVLPGFPVAAGRGGERGSPALADLDGDGMLDVAWGSAAGDLNAFDRRGRTLGGWPVALGGEILGVAVQDFTATRGFEVFASAGSAVYGLHASGTRIGGWPANVGAAANGMPAVGDLDGDHVPEVVVAAGNQVYAYGTSGSTVPGWPARLDGEAGGPPVLADVDGDGKTEVLVGTAAGSAYVLGADGDVKDGWPVELGSKPITAGAAVGDFDGTGKLALVFVAGGLYIRGATVAVFDGAGRPRAGFPRQITAAVVASPLVLDVDGDGAAEILLATYDGSLVALERNGGSTPGYPVKLLGRGVTSTPAAGDLDNDGLVDVVVASQNGYLEAVATGATDDPALAFWPMLGGNYWRTGKYVATTSSRQTLTLAARPGEIGIRWHADERDDRVGWAVLKGVKTLASGHVDYAEVAEVSDQPSSSYAYTDAAVQEGVVYYYKVEERLTSGAVNTYGPKAVRATGGAKTRSALTRCYPNPFTNQVNIAYEVAAAETPNLPTVVALYDISGKLVRTLVSETKAPGEYIAEWDGTDASGSPVASGVYVVCLRAGKGTPPSTKTVVLVR